MLATAAPPAVRSRAGPHGARGRQLKTRQNSGASRAPLQAPVPAFISYYRAPRLLLANDLDHERSVPVLLHANPSQSRQTERPRSSVTPDTRPDRFHAVPTHQPQQPRPSKMLVTTTFASRLTGLSQADAATLPRDSDTTPTTTRQSPSSHPLPAVPPRPSARSPGPTCKRNTAGQR